MWDTLTDPLAGARQVPFVHEWEFVGQDLTDATFKMQVRDSKASGATLRADLATVSTAVEGVRLADVTTTDGVTTSTVQVIIDDTTMAAMDVAEDTNQPGEDAVIYYDMIITPDGGTPFVAVAGTFTIVAGVTVA